MAEFLRNHVDVESPVYTRVQRFVLSAIAARVLSSLSSPSPAPDAGADAAVAALRKAGAEILKEEVHEVAGVVAKLVRSTVDVSEPFYQDILREGPMGQVQG